MSKYVASKKSVPYIPITTLGSVLVTRGWHSGGGGNYYFHELHPHIHITFTDSGGEYQQNVSIYATVNMVAVSDGGQGAGGGGVNFYPLDRAASSDNQRVACTLLDAAQRTELKAIMLVLSPQT